MKREMRPDQPVCPRPFQIDNLLDPDTSLMCEFTTRNGSDKTARDSLRQDGAGSTTGASRAGYRRG